MKANYLPHLAGRVFGVPLLIQPQKLSVILQAIGPRLGLPASENRNRGAGRAGAWRECRLDEVRRSRRDGRRGPRARSPIW